MKRTLLTYVLLVISLTPACSGTTTTQKNSPAVNAADAQAAKKDDERSRELEAEIGQIAADAKGRVGVAALVLETGVAVSLNPRDHFPMQSVYKLPIAMAVLRRVDEGKLKLDERVRVEKSDFVREGQYSPIRDKNPKGAKLSVAELLRYAVAESDGTASDMLLNLAGGAQAVMAFLHEIKVSEINVVNSEKEIGRDWQTQYENWATPAAAVELLAAVNERRGLSAESQSLLWKLMVDSIRGEKRLKGQLPAGTVVAHKTGTGGTRDGVNSATNDIGIITLPNGRHAAIAVFVSDSPTDEATREAIIAKIAKAVWDKWGN
ncbi:MAG: beta-lactamase class [Acidobacteriota bacterium]|nr:beta-lactamase class [Acidobacteriota bacterium]